MTLFAIPTLIAAVIQSAFAALLLGLSRGPGWRSLQWLGLAALTGALYATSALVFTLEDVSEPVRLLGSRFAVAFAGLHSLFWALFGAADNGGRRLRPLERVMVGLAIVCCGVALVPGALIQPGIVERQVSWLGVTYFHPKSTGLGRAVLIYYCVCMVVAVAFNLRRAIRGVAGSGARAVLLMVLLAAVGHDTLAGAGVLDTPYVLELVFLLAVVFSGVTLTRRFVAAAYALSQSHRDLEAMQAELVRRERLAALGELSAVVAHEVRNPLAVLFNATARLQRLVGREQEPAELLGIMSEECERINRTVSDLLQFARPLQLKLERVCLASLVKGAVDAAKLECHASDSSVELELPSTPVALECDPHLVRRALLNLVLNGLQVSTGSRPLRIRAALHDGHVQIDVTDDGPGVPDELRDRIFTPFFTTRAQGTGLGLAVVRKVAELHKGSIEVSAVEGRGAVFTLRLPRGACREAAAPASLAG